MRVAAYALALAAIATTAGFDCLPAYSDPIAPYEMIRSLQGLQSQIAAGSTDAATLQPKLMQQIGLSFSAAAPDVWKEPKNARAAITFVLSGGDPAVLRAVIADATAPADDTPLMQATLAYAEGRQSDAQKLFNAIDPRALPDSLGGQVALVEASLILNDNREKGIKLLDYARLAMPGSLVEEAALRREVLVYGGATDFDKFLSLSGQYIRRFRHSIYADNFLQGFATAVTRFGLSNDKGQFAQVEALLKPLGADDERMILLLVADAAAVAGKTGTAIAAAKTAGALAQDGSVDQARARLYEAAATIVTDNYDDGVQALKSITNAKLSDKDAQLRAAVSELATQIRAPLAPQEQSPVTASASPVANSPLDTAAETVASAQKALAAADLLLAGPNP